MSCATAISGMAPRTCTTRRRGFRPDRGRRRHFRPCRRLVLPPGQVQRQNPDPGQSRRFRRPCQAQRIHRRGQDVPAERRHPRDRQPLSLFQGGRRADEGAGRRTGGAGEGLQQAGHLQGPVARHLLRQGNASAATRWWWASRRRKKTGAIISPRRRFPTKRATPSSRSRPAPPIPCPASATTRSATASPASPINITWRRCWAPTAARCPLLSPPHRRSCGVAASTRCQRWIAGAWACAASRA